MINIIFLFIFRFRFNFFGFIFEFRYYWIQISFYLYLYPKLSDLDINNIRFIYIPIISTLLRIRIQTNGYQKFQIMLTTTYRDFVFYQWTTELLYKDEYIYACVCVYICMSLYDPLPINKLYAEAWSSHYTC